MKTRIDIAQDWIKGYIMELNLCPFAHGAFENQMIEYFEVSEIHEKFIDKTIAEFSKKGTSAQHTFLLIFGDEVTWEELLDIESLFEFFMPQDLLPKIKLVLFHPEYQHGEVDNQVLHYTNKSPFPIIQLLHLDMVSGISTQVAVESILQANEKTLCVKGPEELNILLDAFRE